jgi:hypothetical protein
MRALIVSFAMLAAACTPEPADDTVAAPAADPAAPAAAEPPAAPSATENKIPAAFHGRWDGSLAGCVNGTEQKLTIAADALHFHESTAKPTSVTVINPTSVGINADMSGEGEEWKSSMELVLNGDTLTTTMKGDSFDRVRCP